LGFFSGFGEEEEMKGGGDITRFVLELATAAFLFLLFLLFLKKMMKKLKKR